MAENQPVNKHRMTSELSPFAARLRAAIKSGFPAEDFGPRALSLFALQFEANPVYQRLCRARGLTPDRVTDWMQIPAVPTSAFKELELSCIPPSGRTAVFHSSGTTEQKPSRHFHCPESLAVYETSLWQWFAQCMGIRGPMIFLTPPSAAVPRSSLIHMFDCVRSKLTLPESSFVGSLTADGSWAIDFPAVIRQLQLACDSQQPVTLLGTAFSFVHLLDHLAENYLRFNLPAGSRVMETGGYKNRSRTMPKAELHTLISDRLGVPAQHIICEYGMSELSSQAYDVMKSDESPATGEPSLHPSSLIPHPFHFPPWARVQIVSPETGGEVADGQTGMIRIFDLANVFSVAAIQTEDLGVRCGDGFELIGRAEHAEPRGCSLMTLESGPV